MAKKNRQNAERRARAEALRQQQVRKERRRTLAILALCIVVFLGLLAAALIPYIKHQRAQNKIAHTPLEKVGATQTAAACDPIVTRKANGNGDHRPIGQKITYPYAPPAFGPHWGNFMSGAELRTFYTTGERPELERTVHSLEHGHTLIWYDDTVKPGTNAYKDLQTITDKLGLASYVMAVPWKSSDGKPFPAGKHIALTHWTGPKDQKGAWEYCGAPSGAVVKSFVLKYPKTSAPEPGAA